MADMMTVVKDEWTPTLQELTEKFSPREMRKFFGDIGQKVVHDLKRDMARSKGFSDKKRYRKLKIKWRYHGFKELALTKKNLSVWAGKSLLKDSSVRTQYIRKASGQRVIKKTGIFRDKTKVTSSTRPLIDIGDLLRSWTVRKYTHRLVEVGPRKPAEQAKASYNDASRGHWDWGNKSTDEVWEALLGHVDKGIWKGNVRKTGHSSSKMYQKRFRP